MVGNSLIRFEPLIERIEIVPSKENRYGDLIGSAPAMRKIYGLLDKVAPSELSVVIQGETGTGGNWLLERFTSLLVEVRHLVIFDCSAFPENLLESELFGHEKGAFFVVRTHRGVFERKGGTIFSTELGEMSASFNRSFQSTEVAKLDALAASELSKSMLVSFRRQIVICPWSKTAHFGRICTIDWQK